MQCSRSISMILRKQNNHSESEAVEAAFLCNRHGEVCIAFADPSYVRAEIIVLDRSCGAVHAVMYESDHLLGYVSGPMVEAFAAREEVLLTATRSDGSVFELSAPVCISGGTTA